MTAGEARPGDPAADWVVDHAAPIESLAPRSFRWLRSDHPDAEVGAPDPGYLREDQGEHQTLARILFKHNGYRPGPVRGWYIVVELGAGGYAVGQMRADAFTPVQLFEDLVFGTEDAARARAEQLRGNRPGAMRVAFGPDDAAQFAPALAGEGTLHRRQGG